MEDKEKKVKKKGQVKCPTCGNYNDKENTKTINKRYYCLSCAQEKEKRLDVTKKGWDELFECICEIYKIKTLTGMMFTQIRKFRDEYNYTNTGIQLTLEYYYKTLGNELKEDVALGIVPYYYERAKNHYIDKLNIRKYMEDFEDTETISQVNINLKDLQKNRPKESIRQLSFSNIVWEDEKNNE